MSWQDVVKEYLELPLENQFCSDWLKDQIRSMAEEIIHLRTRLEGLAEARSFYGPAGLKAVSEFIEERDRWKDEYQNVCKFATDYENQRDELRSKLEAVTKDYQDAMNCCEQLAKAKKDAHDWELRALGETCVAARLREALLDVQENLSGDRYRQVQYSQDQFDRTLDSNLSLIDKAIASDPSELLAALGEVQVALGLWEPGHKPALRSLRRALGEEK